jgi:putative salt-induced outer membrane protein YdiY
VYAYKTFAGCVLGVAVVACNTAFADWTGGIEAGTQLGSDQAPALRFYARKQDNPLSHYMYLDWIHESGSSSYRLGYNPTYTISQSVFSFGEFSIEQDDPGGIAREIDARVGVGNHIFRTKQSRFTVHTGIGGSKIELADSSEETDGYFFAGGLFTSKLIGLLKFDAVLESRVADSQTVTSGEAGVSFRVGPNTAIKYAYSVKRYDFDESREDIVNEDSFVTMTYGF